MTPEDSQRIKIKVDPAIATLIPGFLKNREADAREILAALKSGDFDRLKTIGHQMKGLGGAYGFDTISEIGVAVEIEAIEKRAEKLPALAALLADYLKKLEVIFE